MAEECGITVTPMTTDEKACWNDAIEAAAATLDPDINQLKETLRLVGASEQELVRGFTGQSKVRGTTATGARLRQELTSLETRRAAILALKV